MDKAMLPLSADAVVGNQMVLARNVQPSAGMEFVSSITLDRNGSFDGGMSGIWEIRDGQLLLSDVWKKPVFIFRGAEIRNGSVFITGEPLMEAQVSGFVRTILYPYRQLGDNFRICISSHVDYADETIPRILRSLNRLSFPKDRVVVVVGGAKQSSSADTDGYRRETVVQNFDGYTALSFLADSVPDFEGYWLLLHDTTEAAEDFVAKMQAVDVGLSYDMVLRYSEIGLYSSSFIRRLAEVKAFGNKKTVSMEFMTGTSSLWNNLSLSANNLHAATKDVYGTGTQRDVIYLGDFGLKKFRRVKGTGAKP